MKLLFNEKTNLKDFTFLGIANNSKGIGMETLDTEGLKKMKEMDINSSEFYMFYPIKE